MLLLCLMFDLAGKQLLCFARSGNSGGSVFERWKKEDGSLYRSSC